MADEFSGWRAVAPRVLTVAVWVVVCLGAGALGSIFTAQGAGAWYGGLVKPGWTPPGWVFGPVWTVLYVLMGVAAGLVAISPAGRLRRVAIGVFLLQLGLNVAWSAIFFGARAPGWAALELAGLWMALVATVVLFWRVRLVAGALLLPYLGWVTFAGALNVAIWRLNT
ncbi:MAG: TspO/MBR family protein [Phycisphaeraceae bacterium]